jgi:hypothetical protein
METMTVEAKTETEPLAVHVSAKPQKAKRGVLCCLVRILRHLKVSEERTTIGLPRRTPHLEASLSCERENRRICS